MKYAILMSVAICALPTAADADDAPPLLGEPTSLTANVAPAHRNAISVQLATLDTSGAAILGERDLGRRNLSLVVAIGGRTSAQGEFESMTSGVGVELRRWMRRTPMKGWYIGARTDLARTSIDDRMEDRHIGSLTTWTTGLSTGYRWVFFNRIELTPSVGVSMVVEGGMDGRSPTTVRGGGVIGLTTGVVF